jgi:hypothetical protein
MPRAKAVRTSDLLTSTVPMGGTDGWANGMGCPDCDSELSMEQPDTRQPDRLLGICSECGSWALVTLDLDRRQIRVARLPRDPG